MLATASVLMHCWTSAAHSPSAKSTHKHRRGAGRVTWQRPLSDSKKMVRRIIYSQIPTIWWKFDNNQPSKSWDNWSTENYYKILKINASRTYSPGAGKLHGLNYKEIIPQSWPHPLMEVMHHPFPTVNFYSKLKIFYFIHSVNITGVTWTWQCSLQE